MYEFPHPDRVVIDALGPAGEWSFVIQIRQGEHMVAVGVQREAALFVTCRIDSLLREAAAPGWLGGPPETDLELSSLDAPVEVLFNVGIISWTLDTRRGAIQFEFYPDDQDVQEVTAIVQVWLYPGVAKQFAAHARIIVTTADPSCPFCSQSVHAAGRICPRSDGYRVPLSWLTSSVIPVLMPGGRFGGSSFVAMYSWAPVEIPSIPPSQDVLKRFRLHDSSSARTIPVDPAGGDARMYVCGITPYNATHPGHVNTYLTFDLVNRVQRDLGLKVNYVQNVTDVDDPLLERAAATGQDWEELVEDQTELFRSDITTLRVIPPDRYVGTVESIPCAVELIERLLPTGLVYQMEDPEYPDWYFNTADVPDFRKISHYNEKRMLKILAERGGNPERPGERHPLDCLLWRFARPREPDWASALGVGRPGWHIEYTAISLHHLGPYFDLQGGGTDLIFPRHEICAAESRAVTGVPMSGAYVHSGMVALGGEKMSKSKGNLKLVNGLWQCGVDPMAIRLALLGQHYHSDWEWNPQLLERAIGRLAMWRSLRDLSATRPTGETIAEMWRVLRNDLDAPLALSIVDEWASVNLATGSEKPGGHDRVAATVDALLKIRLQPTRVVVREIL